MNRSTPQNDTIRFSHTLTLGLLVLCWLLPTAAWADQNTTTGTNAGASLTSSAQNNTFTGYSSGYSTTGAGSNTFTGAYSGYSNTTGNENTFVGTSSGVSNTTGSYNTYVGRHAGRNGTTGSNNVFIGYKAGYSETGSNKLYIANSSTSTPLIASDFSASTVTINGTLTQTSDRRLKKDIHSLKSALATVMKLRGVTYQWNRKARNFPKGQQVGLIAQEVAKAVPEVVVTNSNGYKAVSYTSLTALLIEGMKQQQRDMRKRQQTIEAQKTTITTQQKEVKTLRQAMLSQQQKTEALQQQVQALKALIEKRLAQRN